MHNMAAQSLFEFFNNDRQVRNDLFMNKNYLEANYPYLKGYNKCDYVHLIFHITVCILVTHWGVSKRASSCHSAGMYF